MSKILNIEDCEAGSIKDILHPNKLNLNIKTVAGSKKIKPNVNIQLTRIDENYPNNPTLYSSQTTESGFTNINSILEGAYLIQIKNKKFYKEELHLFKNNDSICFQLPRFQIFKKHIEVENKLIERLNWLFRYDSKFCFSCKNGYDENKRYYCKRCEKYFCYKHRLPENHGCGGNLKSPSKDLRTIYSRNGTEIRY
jgi:predicted nucleic acid binding AN1-type Zn finger protein